MKFIDLFKRKKPKNYKAGVAFGGGGTKGFAHLGAIKAFSELGIDFSYVSGTSVGSIAAAVYAAGLTYDEIYSFAARINMKDLKSGLTLFANPSSNVEKLARSILGDRTFADMKKPLVITAVDILNGEEVDITSGDVAKAIAASCAVPGIFTPMEIGGRRLVDGGLRNTIPSALLRDMGAETVVSVDINSTRGMGTDSDKTINIVMAMLRIFMATTAKEGIYNSDICIQPDLRRFNRIKLDGMDDMISEGYVAVMSRAEEIKHAISGKNRI